MERALRVVSIERGHDPRKFSLVAFGGAGGLHAFELAQSLTMPRAIIPAIPGALSAYGMLSSDIVRDYSRTLVWSMRMKPPMARLREQFAGLEKKAVNDFRAEGWGEKIRFSRTADLRYQGQGFELNVPFSTVLIEDFHHEHKMRYGYNHDDRKVELVTVRLRARITASQSQATGVADRRGDTAETTKRHVLFDGKLVPTLIYGRESLPPGKRVRGPAIVTEYSATSVIPPGATFLVDHAGNLMIEIVGKRKGASSGAR
jgi:N-methylhydantoinase A